MLNGHTEIVAIIDKSGSMSKLTDDTIGGFNEFLKSQKSVKGTADITLVLFATGVEYIYNKVPLNNCKDLDKTNYVADGDSTALLDAIGSVIDTVGKRLSETEEHLRPEKVMVCILTDGLENHSHKFSNNQIREKIEHQRTNYKWEFVFMGANQDSFLTAGNIGISKQYTSNFIADSVGTKAAYSDMSRMTASYRSNS